MGIIVAILAKVPLWIWLLLGVACWGFYGHIKSNKYEKDRLEVAVETERILRNVESKKLEKTRVVEEKFYADKKSLKNKLDSLFIVNDSLRQQLSTNRQPSDTTTQCGIDAERVAVLERLLRESTALVTEGAERTATLGLKVDALQDYIRQVCVSK